MRMIKQLSDEIRQNIHEAKEKIRMAYKLKDKERGAADWYRDMAAAHLSFNTRGHECVTKMINEAKSKMADNPMTPGMIAVYEEIHADIIAENAEVQGMINAYK